MARKMKDVEPTFVPFNEPGTVVEGALAKVTPFTYQNGNEGTRYELVQDDDERIAFNGTTLLNDRLAGIEIGTYIEVTFVELVDTNQPQPAKVFRVRAEVTE